MRIGHRPPNHAMLAVLRLDESPSHHHDAPRSLRRRREDAHEAHGGPASFRQRIAVVAVGDVPRERLAVEAPGVERRTKSPLARCESQRDRADEARAKFLYAARRGVFVSRSANEARGSPARMFG